jgi:hypothetical protein
MPERDTAFDVWPEQGTFLQFQFQISLSKSIHNKWDFSVAIVYSCSWNYDVVNIDETIFHASLENGWGMAEPEQHHGEFIQAARGNM